MWSARRYGSAARRYACGRLVGGHLFGGRLVDAVISSLWPACGHLVAMWLGSLVAMHSVGSSLCGSLWSPRRCGRAFTTSMRSARRFVDCMRSMGSARSGHLVDAVAGCRFGDGCNQIESVEATNQNRFSQLKRVAALHSQLFHARLIAGPSSVVRLVFS